METGGSEGDLLGIGGGRPAALCALTPVVFVAKLDFSMETPLARGLKTPLRPSKSAKEVPEEAADKGKFVVPHASAADSSRPRGLESQVSLSLMSRADKSRL